MAIETGNWSHTFFLDSWLWLFDNLRHYSSFGNGVDRRHTLKWLFNQEKATLHQPQNVCVYSETALNPGPIEKTIRTQLFARRVVREAQVGSHTRIP